MLNNIYSNNEEVNSFVSYDCYGLLGFFGSEQGEGS